MANDVELATAWIRLVPSMDGASAAIGKELNGAAGAPVAEAGKKAGRKWSAGAKLAMAAGLTAAVGGAVALFNTGLEELKFGEQISRQTDVLIKNTGFAMKTSEIEDFTLALSGVSGVSEEDLQDAGNNILKFGNVSEEAYKRAVASVNDIASTGKDAASTGQTLAKALADPATAAGKLRKAGINLSEQQQDQIKAMTEAGDAAGAQDLILDSLEQTYGGMAEATGGTLEGNINKLTNSWENFAGQTVESLMPAIEGIIAGLQGFVGWISENQAVMPILLGALGFLVLAFVGVTVATWAMNTALLANPITWIVLGIVALIGALILLVMNWDAVVAWVSTIWSGFIGWITGVIDGFVGWWTSVWTGFGSWIAGVWNGIVRAVKVAWLLVSTWVRGVIDGFVGWWNDTWSGIGSFFEDVWNGFVGIVSGVWDSILGFIEGGVNGAIDLINGILQGVNVVGGAFGISVELIPAVNLARGATILPRRGGTIARLAEAGKPESVVDTGLMNRALEEGLGSGDGDGGVTFNGPVTVADPDELWRKIQKKRRRQQRRTGGVVTV